MSKWIHSFLLLIFLVVGCASSARKMGTEDPILNHPSASLALVNGTLIDGTGGDPVLDAVIVIDGERISAVGTRAQISIPVNTPTVDVEGATIMPGFINAHVHQAYDRDRLEAWAQSGVTTVRDLGVIGGDGDLSEKFAFQEEVSSDPR